MSGTGRRAGYHRLSEETSVKMGVESFKASEGWLSKVKERKIACGESMEVSPLLVADSKEKSESIIRNYRRNDIFNCGETGKWVLTNHYF